MGVWEYGSMGVWECVIYSFYIASVLVLKFLLSLSKARQGNSKESRMNI
jgi:hypothetical protein